MPAGFKEKPLPMVVICGPTASGKTALALDLAERFGMEIISADSRQIYRGMDIGTAKATPEERARIPHHLIDVVGPAEQFTAADFSRLGLETIRDIRARGRLPLLVGGTGFYIRALTEGLLDAPPENREMRREFLEKEAVGGEGTLHRLLQETDPDLATRLHPRDRVRIVRALEVYRLTGNRLSELQENHGFAERPFRLLNIGLSAGREELYRRIDLRVERMMAEGLLEEVQNLLNSGISPGLKALQTIGYRESILHLQGELELVETVSWIQRNTRRYAKRQLTWFRKNTSIIWVDSLRESARIHALIEHFYAS
jgi:tRNA dimethylallyltransferase